MSNHTKETDNYKETLKNGEVRYKKIKPCKIDDRFWLTSDPYNLILLDYETVKPRRRYYSSVIQLSRGVLEIKAKDLVGKDWHSLGGIDELIPLYDALIHKISGQLEDYILNIIDGVTE